MTWPFSKRKRTLASLRTGSIAWSARLEAIGALLDASGLGLRDLALSVTDEDVWIVGTAWWSGRERSGWSALCLRLEGGQLTPVGTPQIPPRSPAAHAPGSGWQIRLRALGRLMDRSGQPIRIPVILELDQGFVVTDEIGGTASQPARGLVSTAFTHADIAAARAD